MVLTEPVIRLAALADARPISALLNSFSHTFLLAPTPDQAEAFFATISEPAIRSLITRSDMTYVVAEGPAGAPLAGAAAMRHDGLLFHLFVHAGCQRQGLGRRLWEHLRDASLQAGHAGPFTVHSSLDAVPVYERFGFRVSGARIRQLGGVSVPMRLDPP